MLAKGQPLLLVEANIDGTALLLDLARVKRMRRFVFCSSISVYGDVGPATITEDAAAASDFGLWRDEGRLRAIDRGFAAEYGLEGVSLR